MFCSNCGKELDNTVKFCSECGTQLTPTEPATNSPTAYMRKLTVIREKKLVLSAYPLDVFIDGNDYGQLKNGESKTFEITAGNHRVQLQINMQVNDLNRGIYVTGTKSDVLFINENDGDVTLKAVPKKGVTQDAVLLERM